MWGIGRILALFGLTEDDTDQIPAPELGTLCSEWRQGDIFRNAKAFVFDHNWTPKVVEDTDSVVVISQSCDASLPHRQRIQIAPLVRLKDPDDLREAASGARTQYVAVPRAGADFFADLDGITTVAKTALIPCDRVAGVESDDEVREFAFSVSRRYGRFAYPNEVNDCLNPLTEALKAKARKENSPLGQAVAGVHSIRVQCADWTQPPHQLTLIVILQANIIPFPEDVGEPPDDLDAPTDRNFKAQIYKYVKYLGETSHSQSDRYFAWQYLTEIWARQCEAEAHSLGLAGSVSSVTAELASIDDFPLSRVLCTESLDLDYLSDSRKPMS